ncbi:MAG: DegV family protein [Acidimicrobiales bacterium]
MTVRVVTDSSCDLPDDIAAEHGIGVVPLNIRFGTEEFVDRRDLTAAQFWARCASSPVPPETSAPSPGSFEQAFRAAAGEGGDAVVCITLSDRLSATGASARTAAQALVGELDVRVVDSRSVTLGLGMMAVAAARLAASGASVDEVVAGAEALVARTHVYGALDSLDALKKGGRIGGAQALLGSILSIKPIIEVRDGAVEPGPKQRTRSRALAFLAERVGAAKDVENLAVMHGAAPDVETLLDQLEGFYPRDRIVVGDLGAVVGSHTGARTIGVTFQAQG